MPASAVATKDLKDAIKLAKKRELNFAICLGKKPEGTVIITNRIKDGSALARQAKKEGETPKIAFGKMSVEGREMQLTCENDPPSGMARRTREYLKNSVGLAMTIKLISADGDVLEADGEEEEQEAPADAAQAPDPRAEEWAQKRAELEPQVMKFVSSPANDASKVRAAWAVALEAGDQEKDYGHALKVAANIETMMAAEGGAPAEKGEAPPPGQEKWQAAREKIEPHVLEALKLNTPQKGKIEAVWAFAEGKASATPPDFAAALKALAPLSGLIAQARAERQSDAEVAAKERKDTVDDEVDKLKAEAEMVVSRMRPTVEARLEKGGPATDKIGKAWKIAQDKVTGKEYATALELLKSIGKALGEKPVAPAEVSGGPADQGDGGTPEPGKLGGKVVKKPEIDSTKKKIEEAKTNLGKFPDIPLADWGIDLDAAFQAVNDIIEDASVEDVTSILKDAYNKVESTVAAIGLALVDRETWLKELALFEQRMKILENHAMSTTAPIGGAGGKIAEIKTGIDEAKDAAKNERKYGESVQKLNTLRTLADKAEIYADELAHYTEVAKGRKVLFDALPGSAPGGAHATLVDALAKVKRLWGEAEAEKTAGKFKEGVAKLNEMLEAHVAYRKIVVARDKFNTVHTNFTNRVAAFKNGLAALHTKVEPVEGANSSVKLGLVDEATRLEGVLASATVDAHGYYFAHEKIMRDFVILARILEPRKVAAVKYVPALEALNNAYTKAPMKLKEHPGLEGIQDFVNRMALDLDAAKKAATDYKYGLAEKLLKATAGDWATWDQLGKDYKDYKDKYDVVKPEFDKVWADEGLRSNTLWDAVDLIDNMTAAENARVAKDFKRAKTELEAAEAMITYVKNLQATDEKATEAVKDKDSKLADVKDNFDAAYKIFTDLRALVVGGDNVFADEVAKADVEAKKASDANGKEGADHAQIAKDLQAGIDILEPLPLKVERAKAYKASLQKVKDGITALTGKDPAAKDDREAMEKHVEDAEKAVKKPGYDFQSGEAHMNDALRRGRDAQKKLLIYPKIKTILDDPNGPDKTADWLAGLHATLFTKEVTALRKYDTDVKAKMTAGDYVEAYELAKEAKDQCGRYSAKVTHYIEARDEFNNAVTPLQTTYNGYDQVVKDLHDAKLTELGNARTKMMTDHDFKGALRMCFNMKMEMWNAMGTQKTLDPWKTAKAAAETRIKDLDDVKNAGVTDELTALNKLKTDAEAKATAFKFKDAVQIVDPIDKRVTEALLVAEAYKQYAASKQTAETEIAKLDGKDQVKSLKERVDAKFVNAEGRATAKDYAGAKRLLDQIPGDVANALLVNNENAALDDLSNTVGSLDTDDADAVKEAIKDAQDLLKSLTEHKDAPFVLPRLSTVRTALQTAETKAETDGAAAQKLLQAVIVTCKRLQNDLWHYDQLRTVVDRASTRANELDANHDGKDHVAADLATIKERINVILPDATKSGEVKPGFAAAETIFDDIIKLREFRDAFATYKGRADALAARLLVLDKSPHRYAFKDALDQTRAELTKAAGEAGQSKFPTAETALDKAGQLILDAEIEMRMRSNQPPTADQLKELLMRDDGIAKIDEIVQGAEDQEGLDEPTKRKVIAAAFEARFGCKLVYTNADMTLWADMEGKGATLARMYKAMSILPPTDTKTNDAMVDYWASPEGSGSSFTSATKKTVVREGNNEYSWSYRFGDEFEVGGDVDEECKPANTDPVEALDWNTIHEVGHAVDDNQKYMEKNGAALAGWKFHFGDFRPIAKAIAEHYKYDESYTLAYVSGNADPPIPAAKDGVDVEVWERNRIKVISHIDACRSGNNPWMSNSGAKKLIVKDGGKDRIFHEAYSGDRWVSYDASARKQAITGYQFRAPAEWFSELYAAYHCGKLKDSHPAVTWLEAISPKKETA